MAATPLEEGSAAVRISRVAPLIFRTEDRRISAARCSGSAAFSGISMTQAGRPFSAKTNARVHGLDSTAAAVGPAPPRPPVAQAAPRASRTKMGSGLSDFIHNTYVSHYQDGLFRA